MTLSFGKVNGLTTEEQCQLHKLADVYQYHQSRNAVKHKYYEGHVTLNDVNLGIALPDGLRKLEVGCNWGQKAVDVLADRSMFEDLWAAVRRLTRWRRLWLATGCWLNIARPAGMS